MGVRKCKSWNNGFGRVGDTRYQAFILRDEVGDKMEVGCGHIGVEALFSGIWEVKKLKSYCVGSALKD